MEPDDHGPQPQKSRGKVNTPLKYSSPVFVTVKKSLMTQVPSSNIILTIIFHCVNLGQRVQTFNPEQ